MKIKKQLIKRDIAGDTILVPVGKSVTESKGLFVMNELATFIWDLLPETESEGQIIDAVLREYEVSRDQASADVHAFLEKLRTMDIL